MSILFSVSGNRKYFTEVRSSDLEDYGLLVERKGDQRAINVPASCETLKCFSNDSKALLTTRQASEMITMLYYLRASKRVLSSWISRFPANYHEEMTEEQLSTLWSPDSVESSVPASLCYNGVALTCIRDMLEEILGVSVNNLLYLSYLISRRLGGMLLSDYVANLSRVSELPKQRIVRSPDVLFKYSDKKIPGTSVYRGPQELLALIQEDVRGLLPKSLLTSPTDELDESMLVTFESYWRWRASIDEETQHCVVPHRLITRMSATTALILPQLLRIWTILAENYPYSVVDISQHRHSSLYKLTSDYRDKLIDLLVIKTTEYSDFYEWLVTHREDSMTHTELISLLQGNDVLGEANSRFLLCYIKSFPGIDSC